MAPTSAPTDQCYYNMNLCGMCDGAAGYECDNEPMPTPAPSPVEGPPPLAGPPPTPSPTASPTTPPPTPSPTASPTTPSPTASPTASPTTPSPTASPTAPSPTASPTAPTARPSTSLGEADFDETSDDCRWESTLDGDDLGTSSHSTIMKVDWTDTTYSGSREWILNLGQGGTGAEHWLWNGDSDIQFGVWNGDQISTADVSTCTYLATTYDSSSALYALYCDGELVDEITMSGDNEMDITSDRVLIGEGFSSSQEFEGCIEQVLIYREALTQHEIQTAIADYMS